MSNVDKIAKDLAGIIKSSDSKATAPYDTQATVKRIENGIAWVQIPGGVDETPVQMTLTAKEGDTVQVRVSGGRAWITGNGTNPPTDDKRANVAYVMATSAQEEAQLAHTAAQDAIGYAESARQAADDAQTSADNAQNALKSVVSGAQTVEKAVSVMQTALEAVVDYDPTTDTTQEYFWHDANGAHVLGDTSGYRNDIDSNGMKIMDVSTETSVAEFGASGAQIGQNVSGMSRVAITEHGMQIYRKTSSGDITVANLGYGAGAMGVKAPFYVFGLPQTGLYGHYSVTEGYLTNATSEASHAEGHSSKANGKYSHAQNNHTIASKDSQTAIGKYNIEDTATSTADQKALIIGNGTSESARSNALTVAWDGNVELALDTTAASGTTDGDLYAAIVALGWQNDVIE